MKIEYAAYRMSDGRIIHPTCVDGLHAADAAEKKPFSGIESAIVATTEERNPLMSRFQCCTYCRKAI